ncbi:glycosyltransferase [Lishizhenia sp.]|uniref:glycosyltransferase n=1 Tax=Lishizhenia sp. TaxID=2497594 RepID=UPI00299CEFE8|nr:glycosyltransferase [Lishizhenia sp.]MDX1446564.1 glycosyltransferase [Lishizhenia sp.]
MILPLLSVSLLIIFFYAAFYLVVISRRDLDKETGKHLDLQDITLIIPFRNEAHCIDRIIHALHEQSAHPFEIIFIDDHSTDKSVQVLKDELIDSPLNFRLYHLTDSYGKKAAIHLGVDHAETNFILQWDADIIPHKNYFENLSQLEIQDMWVLPVALRSNVSGLKFFEWDYLFFHALSYKVRNWRVLTASGANLLYKKSGYLEVIEETKGKEYLSGDDYFLLNGFESKKKTIGVSASETVSVQTYLPGTIKGCLQQRLRWLSKSNWLEYGAILFLTLVNLHFLLLLFPFSVTGLIIIGLKTMIDIALVREYLKGMKKKEIYAVPIFFLGLPFYVLLLFLASIILKKEWKGRALKK